MNRSVRVFVVGCARSGTTFTQSFLAAHPRIHGFPETQFFIELIGHTGRRLSTTAPADLPARAAVLLDDLRVSLGIAHDWGRSARRELRFFLRHLGRLELMRGHEWSIPSMRWLSRRFVALLDTLAAEAGKTCWSEKSPRHLFCTDMIERYVPGAKFIHVLREGKDNVASLYAMGLRYPDLFWRRFADIDVAIRAWNNCSRFSRRAAGHPDHFMLPYARLARDPEQALREVTAFLGLEYAESMITQRAAHASDLMYARESWKTQVGADIDRRTADKFETLFDESQKAYILSRLESETIRESESGRPCPPRSPIA
jgi:hypothetical protein